MSDNIGSKNISKMIVIARAIALLSIVSAHICFTRNTVEYLSLFYKMIGSIGVIVYLIISGYYYHPQHYSSFWKMLLSKLRTIGIAWFALGTFGYTYKSVISREFSIISFFKFIIGNGSYLYFMSIIFLCFIIFYKIKSIKVYLTFLGLTITSLLLTSFGKTDSIINLLHITNYLNIFNWIGFFSIGKIMQNAGADLLWEKLARHRNVIIGLFIVTFILLFYFKIPTGYFSAIGFIYELIGAAAVFALSSFEVLDVSLLRKVSDYSFAVYLIHFQIIGMFDFVYNLCAPFKVFANLIIIAISVAAIDVCLVIAKKVNSEGVAKLIFGIRNSERKTIK